MSRAFIDYVKPLGIHVDEEVRQWPIKWLHERMVVNPYWQGIDDARTLLRHGQDTEPIIVCRECFAVVDGAHRLRAYLMEGRRFIPIQFADCHGYQDAYWCQLNRAPGMEYVQAWSHMPSVSAAYHRSDLEYPFFKQLYDEIGQFDPNGCTASRLWERTRAALFGVAWPARKDVLDVGTRESGLPQYLVSKGATVTALDLNTQDVAQGEGIRVVQGDARALPFADNSFDAVTCVSCVNLIPDHGDSQAVRELVRVVKPTCRIAISLQFYKDYREYPSPETARRVYNKEAIYERLVRPVLYAADLCGPVDFDRTDWSYWPYETECKAITDTGMNLQTAVVVLTKKEHR